MNNEKGFTLVEVIISIAVLSILCVIFLQLFVKADTVLDDSKILDQVIVDTGTAVEQVKSVASLEALTKDKLFKDYEIAEKEDALVMTRSLLPDRDQDYVLTISLVLQDDQASYGGLYDLRAIVTEEGEEIYHVGTSLILE